MLLLLVPPTKKKIPRIAGSGLITKDVKKESLNSEWFEGMFEMVRKFGSFTFLAQL